MRGLDSGICSSLHADIVMKLEEENYSSHYYVTRFGWQPGVSFFWHKQRNNIRYSVRVMENRKYTLEFLNVVFVFNGMLFSLKYYGLYKPLVGLIKWRKINIEQTKKIVMQYNVSKINNKTTINFDHLCRNMMT